MTIKPHLSILLGAAVLSTAIAQTPPAAADSPDGVQVAAYYFPNWHREKGDKGRFFGEWENLDRAKPRFPGHEQPKKPLWGYEDESDPAVMARKINAAADSGLDAFIFCFYYHEEGPYLEKALDAGYLKASNKKRLPFALMWANHDATETRKGAISPKAFRRMVRLVIKDYFKDPDYWRVQGRCYFSIYQPEIFIQGMGGVVEARKALDYFRKSAKDSRCGDIHLNLVDHDLLKQADPMRMVRDLGADSVTSYAWVHTPLAAQALTFPQADFESVGNAYFSSWDKTWASSAMHFPNVTMGWDPTPRMLPEQPYKNAGYPDSAVIVNNTPAKFKAALAAAKARASKLPAGQRIVTIYAWNEWTEGGYLEPEARTGTAFLDAIREIFPPTDHKITK